MEIFGLKKIIWQPWSLPLKCLSEEIPKVFFSFATMETKLTSFSSNARFQCRVARLKNTIQRPSKMYQNFGLKLDHLATLFQCSCVSLST
jgi:hypothetical protein